MNVSLWEESFDRTHSQFGIVAIIKEAMVIVNKEIWKAFLEVRTTHVQKQAAKRKNRELQAEVEFKNKQMSASDQCVGLIGEEFSKKWEDLPSDIKLFFAGLSKEDFAKQVSTIKSFSVGCFKSTPKKQSKVQRKSSPSNSEVLTQESLSTIKPPSEIRTNIKAFAAPKNSQQSFNSNKQKKPYNPNFHQQKEFFRQAGHVNSRRPDFKSGGRVDPYSPDVAPMNIFEKVVPIGIHNLSKKF